MRDWWNLLHPIAQAAILDGLGYDWRRLTGTPWHQLGTSAQQDLARWYNQIADELYYVRLAINWNRAGLPARALKELVEFMPEDTVRQRMAKAYVKGEA